MQIQDLTVTTFTPAHLEGALTLSQEVSWPHRREDWAMVLELSEGVVMTEGDTVVGTALRTGFGPDLWAVNMIIVAARMRGRGLGRALMEAILPTTGTTRLIATPEGQPLYEKLGYQSFGTIVQHQGPVTQGVMDPCIRQATADDLPQITALETAAFGGDRSRIIDTLSRIADLYLLEETAGRVAGFAALRPFGRGHVIGPICAPDTGVAKRLISHVAHGRTGQFLRIDTDTRQGLGSWLETLGLPHVGGGTAMQRGSGPLPVPRYGLFSQAIG